MTPEAFQTALVIAEEIRQEVYRVFRKKRGVKLREALGRLKELGGMEIMPYVQVQVGVLVRKPQKGIVFGGIDVSYCDDHELFIVERDPTPRTFLLGEELVTVPDHQCPKCLGERRLDFRNMGRCPECGAELGSEMRIVIDNDACPFCEEKRDSGSSDVCNCGFDWNSEYVVKR